MKNTKKMLALVMALTLLVGGVIGGSLAWLISTPKAVVNTFTAGRLAITLDEAKTNIDGEPVDAQGNVVELSAAPRVDNNEYKLMPGHTYHKDPTIHVQPNSEASYVFAIVDSQLSEYGLEGYEELDLDNDNWSETFFESIKDQMRNHGTWGFFYISDGSSVTPVYYQKVDATDAETTVDLKLFDYVHILSTADNDLIANNDNHKITITAFACQQDGFSSAEAAWNNNFTAHGGKADLPKA